MTVIDTTLVSKVRVYLPRTLIDALAAQNIDLKEKALQYGNQIKSVDINTTSIEYNVIYNSDNALLILNRLPFRCFRVGTGVIKSTGISVPVEKYTNNEDSLFRIICDSNTLDDPISVSMHDFMLNKYGVELETKRDLLRDNNIVDEDTGDLIINRLSYENQTETDYDEIYNYCDEFKADDNYTNILSE